MQVKIIHLRRRAANFVILKCQVNEEDMEKEHCVELVKQCITLAVNRDGSSGGCCRIAIVTKDGIERRLFLNNELNCFGNLSLMPAVKVA